jgi:hypothetical protein
MLVRNIKLTIGVQRDAMFSRTRIGKRDRLPSNVV